MKAAWTPMGKLTLAICALLYGAALTSRSGFLLLLIGVLLACHVLNYRSSRELVSQLKVSPPFPLRAEEGGCLKAPWKISNEGPMPAQGVEIHSEQGLIFQLPTIDPGTTIHVQPAMRFAKRGVFPLRAFRVSTAFPFGLVKAARGLLIQGDILVVPRIYDTPCPPATGFDAVVGGKFKGQKRSNSGIQFAGIRPFQDGDALRQIHWKSSAKGLGLMVKSYDEELSGRIAILLYPGTDGNETKLDDAVRAAGSLLFKAQDEGHHAEFYNFATDEHWLVPPFADGDEILDQLARVTPITNNQLPLDLEGVLARISHRASLCLITSHPSSPLLQWFEHLIQQGKRARLYLPRESKLPDSFSNSHLVHSYGTQHIEEASAIPSDSPLS